MEAYQILSSAHQLVAFPLGWHSTSRWTPDRADLSLYSKIIIYFNNSNATWVLLWGIADVAVNLMCWVKITLCYVDIPAEVRTQSYASKKDQLTCESVYDIKSKALLHLLGSRHNPQVQVWVRAASAQGTRCAHRTDVDGWVTELRGCDVQGAVLGGCIQSRCIPSIWLFAVTVSHDCQRSRTSPGALLVPP